MMRFSKHQNLTNTLIRLVEFIAALVLLSWSVTRYPVDVFVSRMSYFLLDPFVNFLIGNTIVMLLLFIYRKSDVGLNSVANDMQYEYFQISAVPDCLETDGENKQFSGIIGDFVNTQNQNGLKSNNIDADNSEQIISIFDSTISQIQCDLVTTKPELLNSKVHGLQRTKSELVNYEGRNRTRGKLRRSESEISTRAVSSFETVDKLSNEEFKHTIEAFIANHQRFLWAQKANE